MSALILALLLIVAAPAAAAASVEAEFSATEDRLVTIDGGPVAVDVVGRAGDRVFAELEVPDGYPDPQPLLQIESGFDRISVQVFGVQRTGVKLVVVVPERADLRLRTGNAGPTRIQGVVGELDVFCSNSSVELVDVGGSATVATSNGEIVASFAELALDRVMSFITSNGEIDITFPASLRADVYMETDNGELVSDFEIRDSGSEARDRLERRGERLKVVREGAIGGGGPFLRLLTDNSSVYLRSKP